MSFLHGIEVVEVTDGVRPIRAARSSVIGIVGTAPDADANWPLNTPVLIRGQRSDVAGLGSTGTLPAAIDDVFDQAGALIVVIRIAEGADDAETLANLIGGVDGDTGQYQGVHALLTAKAITNVTPRILCVPGFGHEQAAISEMVGIADRLRAMIIADGPSTNDADAIAARGNYGSARVYMVESHVEIFDTTTATTISRPASARAAGLIARIDQEKGFWWSPSNQEIYGITGTTRPIEHSFSDPNAQSNLLNENEVATIIRSDGFRLWGNRTCSSDPQWAFLSVRRTADMIYEAIERAHQWALDRPFSAQLSRDITDGVNAYLRQLKAQGAILGGRAWLDEELNSEETLKSGQLFVNFDIEPPAPLERLTFRAHRNDGYYTEVFTEALAA